MNVANGDWRTPRCSSSGDLDGGIITEWLQRRRMSFYEAVGRRCPSATGQAPAPASRRPLRAGRASRGARRPEPGRPLPGRARPGDRAEGARVRGLPARRQAGRGRRAGALAGVPARRGARQHGGRERVDGARREPARGDRRVRRRTAGSRSTARRSRATRPSASGSRWRRSRSRRRFGDRDLEFERAWRCWARRTSPPGGVAEGMTLLDEAMAAVSGGEVARIGADRRDLLQAAERLRARHRRQARRAVAGRGRPLRRLERLRAADLPARTTAGS